MIDDSDARSLPSNFEAHTPDIRLNKSTKIANLQFIVLQIKSDRNTIFMRSNLFRSLDSVTETVNFFMVMLTELDIFSSSLVMPTRIRIHEFCHVVTIRPTNSGCCCWEYLGNENSVLHELLFHAIVSNGAYTHGRPNLNKSDIPTVACVIY